MLDLRAGINISTNEESSWESPYGDKAISYEIVASLADGTKIGNFNYTISINKNNVVDELNIENVDVKKEYQNLGIGQLMYKEFGETYNQKYNGIPIGREYINPVAEYAFRKAVSLGWISEDALNEEKMDRSYGEDDPLRQDLRKKIPEQYRGTF